jgi:hypothetical protein
MSNRSCQSTTNDEETTPPQVVTPPPTGGKVLTNRFYPDEKGPNGCYLGDLTHPNKRRRCRYEANLYPVVGDNDYAIDCDVTLGDGPPAAEDTEWPKDNPGIEITSGGPGASHTIVNPTSPGTKGQVMIPGHYMPGYKLANDPDRIRTDAVTSADYNGGEGPVVTILDMHTYKGGYGYYYC